MTSPRLLSTKAADDRTLGLAPPGQVHPSAIIHYQHVVKSLYSSFVSGGQNLQYPFNLKIKKLWGASSRLWDLGASGL